MPVFTKPGLTRIVFRPCAAELVVEAGEVIREPGLGGAVEQHRLAGAIAGHRAEHAQPCRAAAGQQALARQLAELDGVGEVGGEQAVAQVGVLLERVLRGEESGA